MRLLHWEVVFHMQQSFLAAKFLQVKWMLVQNFIGKLTTQLRGGSVKNFPLFADIYIRNL